MIIKKDVEQLKLDVKNIIKKFKVKKKTQIQCIYPFLYMVNEIQEEIVFSGLCADELYGTSRKMQILGRTNDEEFYKKRNEMHEDIESSSYIFIKNIFNAHNKEFVAPYKDNIELVNYFLNKNFKELHSPKQKNLTYINYKKEIEDYKLYRKNSNLQCNSNIREWHNELLFTELNKNN